MSEKYTFERLGPIVASSDSVAEVLRKLGVKQAGGTHAHISRKIKRLGINTSHFLGQKKWFKYGGMNKRPYEEVLKLKHEGSREEATVLRRALLEAGLEYKCSECLNQGEWNDKQLILQVDHINRNWLDNRKENLRFLCPNCHSQTDGWCGRKEAKLVTYKAKLNKEPKPKEVTQKKPPTDPMWRTRPRPEKRKVIRPSYGALLQEIEHSSFLSVGRKYGVSDNAIRKWLRYEQKRQ